MKRIRVLPREWKEVIIGEEFKTGSGGTPLSTKKEYYEGGTIPWINSGELNENYIDRTENYITELGLNNSSAKIFPKGTVLVAMYGATAGKSSMLNIDACTNQAVCAILENPDYSNLFLKYNIENLYDYLVRTSTGSARDNLSQEGIANLSLFSPKSKELQERLIRILEKLDKKIALNARINAELEAMAKQLYDYWFVQFDFPDENGKPYKSSGGKMVYNEKLKREIPEGWEPKKLRDILVCKNDSTVPGEHLSSLDYCPIDELPIRKISFAGGKSWKEAQSSLQLYKAKNILIGAMRVYFHRCCISSEAGITRTTTIVLIPNNDSFLNYAYQVCNEERTFEFAIKESTGTQQPYVTWSSLSEYIFPYPNENLIQLYCKRIDKLIDNILINVRETKRLTHLRDSLLPMLMNGQVTVEE